MKGVVSVAQGRLRGVWREDLWSFSGIPYARAPIGELRWRPPLTPESWDEIRDASTFGPIAPQSASVPGITSPSDPEASEPQSEDCLFLNVWTPRLPESQVEARGCRKARSRLHPRGRIHLGQRIGISLPGRKPRPQRGCRGRDDQLPARRAGLLGSPDHGRSRRAGRKLGHPRSGRRAGVGATTTSQRSGGIPPTSRSLGSRQERSVWPTLLGIPVREGIVRARDRAERRRACAYARRGRALGGSLGCRVGYRCL